MAGDYKIEDIYQGGYSSLKPSYGELFTGYHASAGTIGTATSPFTTNILKEVSDKLAPGQKAVEVSMGIFPDRAPIEAIPKQHLKEVNRLAKLTGVDITVHGPLTDASGVTQQGFDDQQREIAERKIFQALEKSHEINPNGNVPVTFHSANQLPGARYSKKDGEEIAEMIPVVNQETGEIRQVAKREERVYPGLLDEKENVLTKTQTAEEQLKIINETSWDNSLDQIEFQRENAERIMRDIHPIFIAKYAQLLEKQAKGEKIHSSEISPEEYEEIKKIYSADAYLREAQKAATGLFDKAYKFGTEEQKKALTEMSKNYGEIIRKNGANPKVQSQALFELRGGLNQIRPEIYKPAEEYALEKSKETFGNAAWQSYKKFGEKSPIISIENPPAGMGLSRAEDIKNMVEGSRKQFVKNAVENGMSKPQAEKQAEKLIGVTWDVGHINQLRQFGFSSEDIIKEAEKIAPLLKHLHLSDNFGMENVEIPMGMGNVDFKEVMEKLGEKGEKAKKISETGNWWTTFQTSPVGMTMEALGSPIYSMQMGPYWNQVAGFEQGYFGGYGATFPPINYETFGGSFSRLPAELGGQRPGAQGGRMSGTPME